MVEFGIQLGRFERVAEALWLAAERRSVERRGQTVQRYIAALLLIACLATAVVAVAGSHQTEGEIVSAILFLVVLFGLFGIGLPLSLWKPQLGASLVFAIWILVVPRQIYLGVSLWRAEAEARRIVAYAYEHLRTTGRFPDDLSDYTLDDPGIRAGIYAYRLKPKRDGFSLDYGAPGQEDVAHTYDTSLGWYYYPD